MKDGRYIDESLGVLAGEGAQQRVRDAEERLEEIAREAEGSVPAAAGGQPTYYDRPAIKEPVWKWYIPAYFYAGGTAGAASLIGAAAQATGDPALRGLVRRSRWLATTGIGAGTALLILDLGRPERFHHMLRVFRPTSPMNLGSWLLSIAGPLNGAASILARSSGTPGALGDAAGLAAGALGPALSTYTAVLTSNSAIPVWQETRRALPWLFAASSLASATSLLGLARGNPAERRLLHPLDLVGTAGELIAAAMVERDASRVERVGRPLRQGASGAMWTAAKVCTAASLALSLLPGTGRKKRVLAALLGAAGALAGRLAIMRAGIASARDPRATFAHQRAGRGGAAATGTPGITGPRGERAHA